MAEPDVTVVVVPRERFSVARRALECLLSKTHLPVQAGLHRRGLPAVCEAVPRG